MKRILIYTTLIVAILSSCVPARKYEELKTKQKECKEEVEQLRSSNRDLEEKNMELTQEIEKLRKDNKSLRHDTTVLGKSLKQMTNNYDNINETYQLLLDKNKELLAGNQAETQKLMEKLQETREDLQKREDALRALEKDLNAKKKNLEQLKAELKKREKRVEELENLINRKDSAVTALKNKVQNALLGFEGEGLTIERKNGKVYVSMEEKLLFASGQYNVNSEGVKVLKKLGDVLEKTEDINIMVEGHTDNVPYKGSGAIKDNWDLSVKRATSVVKILLSNSQVEPSRLIAAGRGEHLPLKDNDTTAGKQANRRTEIILTPKLSELFDIIEQQSTNE